MLDELEEANQGTLKKMKTFISQARRRTNLLVASVQQASAFTTDVSDVSLNTR